MRNFIKVIISIIAVVIILLVVYFIGFYPTRSYERAAVDDEVNIRENLLRDVPQSFSLQRSRIKTSITLTEKEISSLIMANMQPENNVEAVDVVIDDNKLKIYMYTRALGFIPMEVSMHFRAEDREEKSVILMEDYKLGLFNLDKYKLLNRLEESSIMFMEVDAAAGEIVLEDTELGGLIAVTAVTLEEGQFTADLEIRLNNIQDFLKLLRLLT
jgi:uncharacterized protein YneF (UPF0154 family)